MEEKPRRKHKSARRSALAGLFLTGASLIALNRLRALDLLIADRLKPLPRTLENEKAYRDFLATIPLRYISAEEIIRPHRNTRGGVPNSLPPKRLWKNIR